MKTTIVMLGIALCMGLASCGSENRDNTTEDTNTMDSSMMDTSMNENLDTTGISDTAGVDSMYRNSPARSDTKSGHSGQ